MNVHELKTALNEKDDENFVQIFFEKAQCMQMNPNPFQFILTFSRWKKVSENTRRAFLWFSNLAEWTVYPFNDMQKEQIFISIQNIDEETIKDILCTENPLLFIQEVQKEFQQINPEMFRNLRMLFNSLKDKAQGKIFDKLKKLPGVSVTKDQFDELIKDKISDKKLFPALNERGSLEFIRMLPEELQDEVTEKADTVDKLVWFEQKWQEKSCVEEKAFEWLKDLAVDARQTFSDKEEVRYLIHEVDINDLIDVLISKDALQLIGIVKGKADHQNSSLAKVLAEIKAAVEAEMNPHASESECSIL